MMKRTSFFAVVISRKPCRFSWKTFSFFSISGWGIDLDYCDIEEMVLSYLRLHPNTAFMTLVESYSISSSGFLPTVVDIMVI